MSVSKEAERDVIVADMSRRLDRWTGLVQEREQELRDTKIAMRTLRAAKDAEIAALQGLLGEITAHAFPVACDCDDCLMSDGLRARASAALEMSGGAK